MTLRCPKRPVCLALLSMLLGACLATTSPEQKAPTRRSRPGGPVAWTELLTPAEATPIRFVGSRGHRVTLTALESTSVVRDPVAWSELKLTLQNGGAQPEDGSVEITLPGSTFVADVTVGQKGEPTALREAQVPAGRGDRIFRTPLVKLAAGETKVVTVRHAGALSGADRSLQLRFAGLDKLAKASVLVRELGASEPSVEEAYDGKYLSDLLVRSEQEGEVSAAGVTFLREVSPALSGAPPSSVIVLIDTSVSRARDLAAEASMVHTLAGSLAKSDPLVVAAYDEDVATLYEGAAGELDGRVAHAIAERGALGRSNTKRALEWALEQRGGDTDRVLLVTDGIDDASSDETSGIASALRTKFKNWRGRIDVVTPSGPRSSRALASLATEVAARRGHVVGLYDGTAVDMALATDPEGTQASEEAWSGPPGVVTMRKTSSRPTDGVPAWIGRVAGKPQPREHLSTLEATARPFPEEDAVREDVDPLSTLTEKKRPAAEPQAAAPTPEVVEPKAVKPSEDPRPRSLPPETIQQIVRKNFGRFRGCYQEVLRKIPQSAGKIVVLFTITPGGDVSLARSLSSDIPDVRFIGCVVRAFEQLNFPASEREPINIKYPLQLSVPDGGGKTEALMSAPMFRTDKNAKPSIPPPIDPWQGDAKYVYEAIARGAKDVATEGAFRFLRANPDEPFAYVLLGDARRAANDQAGAQRAYASLLELGSSNADLLRLAAGRLRATTTETSSSTAESALARAIELEPSEPSAYEALASLRAERRDYEGALRLLDVALGRTTDIKRYPGVRDLLRIDLGMIGAAHAAKTPAKKRRVERWLADVGAKLATAPSLRVGTSWSGAGANVDLVIRDRGLWTARKSEPSLPTGGHLSGDVAGAPGPEAFVLEDPAASRNYPYAFSVGLASSTGTFAAGTVSVMEIDASSKLGFREEPFLIQATGAELEVLSLDRSIFD